MSDFVNDVLAGRALQEDLNDYVERWHTAPEDSTAATLKLHAFLGMTWEEYRLITENPYALRFVIASHKNEMPVEEVVREASSLAVAARSESQSEAQKVFDWLVQTNRINS